MLNKVILIGRLTKDPELRTTTSGVSVGSFTLAVNRNYVNQNGVKEADFINCICYRKLADILKAYVRKGQLISIEGRIQTRSYDAQDGSKRYVTEVVCDNIVFLESSRTQNASLNQQTTPTFNINNQQPRFNSNQNEMDSSNEDPYFDDLNTIISEDDLPF